jgi:hypothetical protein
MRPALHLVGPSDAPVERRACRTCPTEGPRAELFPKNGNVCNACVAARTKAWREADPERARRSQRAHYADNHQEIKAKAHAYYASNREIIAAKRRALYDGPKGDEVRAAVLERYHQHADDINRAARKRRRQSLESVMLREARSRAAALGVPFDLTLEDIFIPPTCPVLGIPLFVSPEGRRGACPNSPSLDRLIPSMGYVRGNVAVVSWRANRLKSDGTSDELQLVAAWVRATMEKAEAHS